MSVLKDGAFNTFDSVFVETFSLLGDNLLHYTTVEDRFEVLAENNKIISKSQAPKLAEDEYFDAMMPLTDSLVFITSTDNESILSHG